jgi:hypothetical protein
MHFGMKTGLPGDSSGNGIIIMKAPVVKIILDLHHRTNRLRKRSNDIIRNNKKYPELFLE